VVSPKFTGHLSGRSPVGGGVFQKLVSL
jgi:hypothetical protein